MEHIEHKKRNISLRMNTSDLSKIKQVAQRLHAREADVFRFAIKMTLAKLAPMLEARSSGSDLLPVFMEFGPELAKYFELDATLLNRVFNEGVDDERKRVDQGDIELMALAGVEERYAIMRLREMGQHTSAENNGVTDLLRDYLSTKYLRGTEQVVA